MFIINSSPQNHTFSNSLTTPKLTVSPKRTSATLTWTRCTPAALRTAPRNRSGPPALIGNSAWAPRPILLSRRAFYEARSGSPRGREIFNLHAHNRRAKQCRPGRATRAIDKAPIGPRPELIERLAGRARIDAPQSDAVYAAQRARLPGCVSRAQLSSE